MCKNNNSIWVFMETHWDISVPNTVVTLYNKGK